METAIFDTHAYVKRLVAAGMPEPQAEIIADEQRSLIDNKLATKQDIKALEVGLRRDIKQLEAATKRDIAEIRRDMKEMEAGLRRDIRESEQRVIIHLGSMMVVAVGVVAALVKLL